MINSPFLRDAIGNLTHLLRCSSGKMFEVECRHDDDERHWPSEKKELSFLVQRPPEAFLNHVPEPIKEIGRALAWVDQLIIDRRGNENHIHPMRMLLYERYSELKWRRWLICSRVFKVGTDDSQR